MRFSQIPVRPRPWEPPRRPSRRRLTLSRLPIAVVRRHKNRRDVRGDSALESLPFEIRDQIISLLDLQQLRSLVHACPVFHAQYRQKRTSLLCKCLETSLSGGIIHPRAAPVVGDPLWAYYSSGRVRSYDDWRVNVLGLLRSRTFTRLEAIDTATFFFYFVSPLICSYATYKQEVQSAEVGAQTELEHRRLNDHVKDARPELDDFEEDLHYFLSGCQTWRSYYGMGFLKKALLREESLHLSPTRRSRKADILVFDAD